MDEIRRAEVVAFYLFDVAEQVDLTTLTALIGQAAVPARLLPKPATPAYVQYGNPPISFDGDAVGVAEVGGLRARVRVYDYGVMSVALTRPFAGSWDALVACSQTLVDNPVLERDAEALCRRVLDRVAAAVTSPRARFLTEDYVVFSVHELDQPASAATLLSERGAQIAAVLRGEAQPLSPQERESVLAHHISYLADDLVVPSWNAAFVYDTPAGARAALEIIELANSQLLEYRYYDEHLDAEMTSIYARLQRPRALDQWIGSRFTRAARHVHALFIDVNQLTDRTENTIKFIGDLYAVRLFRLVAGRLGLDTWKGDVEQKLETLDAIYRFAVEQTAMVRGHYLELIVVVILILELVLILMGVMQ